ncbi:MAG: Dabb family protein [Spirochaetota bacterium]
MTRHCVLFSFIPGSTRQELAAIEARFEALRAEIAEIEGFEWGTNSSPEGLDKGFTHCFFLSFADDAARDRYLVHPRHQAFGAFVRPFLADVLVVDYRIPS